ncbi:MAG: hypothetical protein RMK35_04485 [Aquificaceae bacterium]|nr:hypothetical protein [Aquificaceae bacterium]MDW8434045.1 hypothetical protein [Aquificaceae bacterium]
MERLPIKIIQILFGSNVSEVLENTFHATKERKADFMERLEDGTIVHIEIQSSYDSTLPMKLIELYLMIYERYKVYPLQFLLWVGDGKCPYKEKYRLGELKHRVKVVDMKKISCREFIESEVEETSCLLFCVREKATFWIG